MSMSYQWCVPINGMHRNCTTYRKAQTGTNALMATSQQYPNSSSSLPESSPRLYSPLRRPGSKLLSGPNKRPTRKKNRVAITSERRRKWPNMKTRVMWRVCVKPSAYAKPQASDVSVRKKESRYVKEGSGRWYDFVVCFYDMVNYAHSLTERRLHTW